MSFATTEVRLPSWPDGIESQLRELRAVTNDCIGIIKSSEQIMEAINWAHLTCTQSVFYHDDQGSEGFRVLVEEVSPDASKFRAALSALLLIKGWPNVEIVTEW